MQKVLSYMWIDRVSERNSPTICVNYHFWKQNKLDQMSVINALNLILSKFCWCIVWEVARGIQIFTFFTSIGKLTSRVLNPYKLYCHTLLQIWVIKQETTWSTKNLPYSRVLKKKHISPIYGIQCSIIQRQAQANLNNNVLLLMFWLMNIAFNHEYVYRPLRSCFHCALPEAEPLSKGEGHKCLDNSLG